MILLHLFSFFHDQAQKTLDLLFRDCWIHAGQLEALPAAHDGVPNDGEAFLEKMLAKSGVK